MAKNPIFPLYYNDILGSTKTWTDEEFGAYMRLLIEQWDNGFIPSPYQNSTKPSTKNLPLDFQRLSRIATSVEQNWQLLSTKFTDGGEGLQNENLEKIRLQKSKHAEKQRDNILKRYQTSTKPPTNQSTKPPTKNLPLEDEYEIEEEIDTSLKERGVGKEKFLVPQMVSVFKEAYPKYPVEPTSDFTPCMEIAEKIAQSKGWTKASVTNGRMDDVLAEWRTIVVFSKTDKWFRTRSISDFNKEFQRLIQSLNHHQDDSSKPTPGKTPPTDKF